MFWTAIVLRCCVLCVFLMRKRLAAFSCGEGGGSEATSSGSGAVVRGGLRKRLAPGAGQTASTSGIDVTNKPLNKLLMKKWCKGKLTCRDVFEFGSAASQQGCPDIEKLAKSDLHNAARNLMAAVGFPEKAPKISVITVQSKHGPKELAIICPIDALEKTIKDDNTRFEKSMKARCFSS